MDVPDCPENWDYLWEGYSFLMVDKSFERNRVIATNSNLRTPLSLEPDPVFIRCFKN